MAKQYSRKTLSSLDELDLEQARIRRAYHSMEHHFLESVFQPEKLAFALGGRLVKGLASLKKNKPGKTGGNRGKPSRLTAESGKALVPVWSPLLKRMARSWIRWQAFNLAFFLGKTALKCFQQRRRKA